MIHAWGIMHPIYFNSVNLLSASSPHALVHNSIVCLLLPKPRVLLASHQHHIFPLLPLRIPATHRSYHPSSHSAVALLIMHPIPSITQPSAYLRTKCSSHKLRVVSIDMVPVRSSLQKRKLTPTIVGETQHMLLQMRTQRLAVMKRRLEYAQV
jgi:hypothetical protein